jgi:uncharacterized protein
MQCPVCKDVTLIMADKQGIEIDYCPQCRGVWLDRGELDKIIERSVPVPVSPVYAEAPRPRDPRDHDDYHEHRHPDYRRKKKGFLGELFDFD